MACLRGCYEIDVTSTDGAGQQPIPQIGAPNARLGCEASYGSQAQRAVRQPLPDVGVGHRRSQRHPSVAVVVLSAGSVRVCGIWTSLEEYLTAMTTLPSSRAEASRLGYVDELRALIPTQPNPIRDGHIRGHQGDPP